MNDNEKIINDNKNNDRKHYLKRKKLLRRLLSAVLLIVLLSAALLEYLTLTEYRPEPSDTVAVDQENWDSLSVGETVRILTWNCGYGALGDNADFFMDGGKGVMTADRERVQSNIDGIVAASRQMDPDVILYQEVDTNAARSHFIDESITMINALMEENRLVFSSAYADNLNVRFIPYPVPPVGRVKSGLLSLTEPLTNSAERIQLPCSFKWPVRLANFKRCLLLERLPLKDSSKELVIINLHMDAYDSGEGKTEQTRVLSEIMNREAEKGNYVIAGGDFNQTFDCVDPGAFPLQEGKWAPGVLETGMFGEGWQFLMDVGVPTCRSLDQAYAGSDKESFQYYAVDGFIVSSNIEVRSCRTKDLGFVCTDHNPVLMECALK